MDANSAAMAGMNIQTQIPDRVIMYASHFIYNARERVRILNYTPDFQKILQFEKQQKVVQGSAAVIQKFMALDENDQREFLKTSEQIESLLRGLVSIVDQIYGDKELTYWALCLLNGIIEDARVRLKHLEYIQKTKQQDQHLDCIKILYSYVRQQSKPENCHERDLAAHVLAMLIEAHGYAKCQDNANYFLKYLIEFQDDQKMLSKYAYTHCLMYLLKINELAQVFVSKMGFNILKKILQNDCLSNGQIAYNVCCTLWILSYNDFAMEGFTDFKLNIIEHVSKILDFFNKEKIVRIICMLFYNLKDNELCLEHLSMINALNLVIKLQNRPWVDQEIVQILEDLFKFFDMNYQEFSSFEKWKAQVMRKSLAWSPVHTEKFWQTSFIFFNEAENLECINILIDILSQKQSATMDQQSLDQMKAIACYDLGEFARFYPLGKQYLMQRNANHKIAELMGSSQSSAELKKEAITAYQKFLMHAFGQHN